MKTYKISAEWNVSGTLIVEAESYEEALSIVEETNVSELVKAEYKPGVKSASYFENKFKHFYSENTVLDEGNV